jgi:shikimate dehydrogenase
VTERRGAAVLGMPIAHSLSPVLHEAAYSALGLTGWTYQAIECDEESLRETLQRLESEGLIGASLTMPLKRAVLPLLTRTDRTGADVGAVNTVLFGGVAGEWWGANTDVPGMVAAIAGVDPHGFAPTTACVLGGGATAASALAALRDLGLASCTVCVRRPGASHYLEEVAARLGLSLDVRRWDDAVARMSVADIVISTTPAGATDNLAGAVRPGSHGVLFDVVYAPWPTGLAGAWSARGGRVIGGLELLVQQAVRQVELMTGQLPPVDVVRRAGLAALERR